MRKILIHRDFCIKNVRFIFSTVQIINYKINILFENVYTETIENLK